MRTVKNIHGGISTGLLSTVCVQCFEPAPRMPIPSPSFSRACLSKRFLTEDTAVSREKATRHLEKRHPKTRYGLANRGLGLSASYVKAANATSKINTRDVTTPAETLAYMVQSSAVCVTGSCLMSHKAHSSPNPAPLHQKQPDLESRLTTSLPTLMPTVPVCSAVHD